MNDRRPIADPNRGHRAEVRHAARKRQPVAGHVERRDDVIERQDELILVAHGWASNELPTRISRVRRLRKSGDKASNGLTLVPP